MEILGSLSTAAANGNDSFRCDNFKEDYLLEGFLFDIQMPVNVGVSGTPITSDLVALLKYFLAQFSLAYGPSQEFKAFEGVSGDELRNVYRTMALKEVPNNFIGVATGGTGPRTWGAQLMYLCRPVYHAGRPKLPGHDVAKTIRLDISEGNAFPAGSLTLTRGAGACVIAVVPMYRKGKAGALVHLPHYRRINQSRLDVETPEGLVIAAWDDNAPFATTAIGKYLVRTGDDEPITNVPPLYMNDAFSALIDAGGSNPTDAYTLLYFADPFEDIERWPHGRVYVKLVSQDVPTIKLRALYYPEMVEDQVAAWAKHIAEKRRTPVLITKPASLNADVHPGAAAIGPFDVHPSSTNEFQNKAGVLGTADGQVHLSVPEVIRAAVTSATGAAGAGSQDAVRSAAVHAVVRKVPGSIDSRGKRRGGARAGQGVLSHFESLGHVNQNSK